MWWRRLQPAGSRLFSTLVPMCRDTAGRSAYATILTHAISTTDSNGLHEIRSPETYLDTCAARTPCLNKHHCELMRLSTSYFPARVAGSAEHDGDGFPLRSREPLTAIPQVQAYCCRPSRLHQR